MLSVIWRFRCTNVTRVTKVVFNFNLKHGGSGFKNSSSMFLVYLSVLTFVNSFLHKANFTHCDYSSRLLLVMHVIYVQVCQWYLAMITKLFQHCSVATCATINSRRPLFGTKKKVQVESKRGRLRVCSTRV